MSIFTNRIYNLIVTGNMDVVNLEKISEHDLKILKGDFERGLREDLVKIIDDELARRETPTQEKPAVEQPKVEEVVAKAKSEFVEESKPEEELEKEKQLTRLITVLRNKIDNDAEFKSEQPKVQEVKLEEVTQNLIKKNNKEKKVVVVSAIDKKNIIDNARNVKTYIRMGKNLSKLNTSRGGNNFKGFTFEELIEADQTVVTGKKTVVVNNNGPADLKINHLNGKVTDVQAKVGYKNNSAGLKNNECKTVIVDKGNEKLIREAKNAGKKVIESNITESEASKLAKAMKVESKITGSENSVIVSNAVATVKAVEQIHKAGVNAAGKGGAAGGGFSLGANIVEVMSGDKTVEDVAADVVVDTVVSAGVGYTIGATTTAVASTAAGAAISSTVAATSAAVTTAAGAAVVAAAPLVVAGAAIGALAKIFRR